MVSGSGALNDGVYILVSSPGPIPGYWFVQVPEKVEEKDFQARIEAETGLKAHGPAYPATITQLKLEYGQRKQHGGKEPYDQKENANMRGAAK
jgi:hypothetical protein